MKLFYPFLQFCLHLPCRLASIKSFKPYRLPMLLKQARVSAALGFSAAVNRLTALEDLAGKLRRWTNSVLPNKSLQITNPSDGREVAGAPGTDWPNGILKRAAERSNNEVLVNGPMAPDEQVAGVWSSSVHVKEAVNPNAKQGGIQVRNLKPVDVTKPLNGQAPGKEKGGK